MQHKIMKTYRSVLGFMLLPAMRLYGCHRHDLSKTRWTRPPAGSVAPLY